MSRFLAWFDYFLQTAPTNEMELEAWIRLMSAR